MMATGSTMTVSRVQKFQDSDSRAIANVDPRPGDAERRSHGKACRSATVIHKMDVVRILYN